jgi:thiamine-phosphate pyrophosphorylase
LILPDPPILVITDRRMAARPLGAVVESALDGGCRWVLLREPDLDTNALTALGREIAPLCEAHNAVLAVSADLEAAAAIGAGGLHLPQRLATADMVAKARERLGADALVGISCHSLAEAATAEQAGADYVTLSPVFLTDSKPGYGPALGTGPFGSAARQLGIPALGLAGISVENAAEVHAAGAAGIAVMGNVMRAANPARFMEALIAAWRG